MGFTDADGRKRTDPTPADPSSTSDTASDATASTGNCIKCGRPIRIGDWPWCPHSDSVNYDWHFGEP